MILLPVSILIIEDEGDRAFIARLYIQHSDLMFGIALSYLRDYHDAQDAVNDAVVRLIDKIPELKEKNGCILRSYVVTTIVRTSLNALRKRSRQNQATSTLDQSITDTVADDGPPVDSLVISRITNEELLTALEKLPERERNLLRWKYFDEYQDEEIAAFLNIGKNSVRAYLTNARRQLYSLLEEWKDNEP